jgi:hypothetical protein
MEGAPLTVPSQRAMHGRTSCACPCIPTGTMPHGRSPCLVAGMQEIGPDIGAVPRYRVDSEPGARDARWLTSATEEASWTALSSIA